MQEWLSRTELLFGADKIKKLEHASVLIMGLGGVGAYAAELICRSGVGAMTIVDGDVVNPSNRNRQLPALISNNGKSKALLMQQRLLDINPLLELTVVDEYIYDEKMKELILSQSFDYVVDAIDTISPKLFLILYCIKAGYPIVSSMGAGGKTDPLQVRCGDISESKGCALARVIRKRLHRQGIYRGIKSVWSTEIVNTEAIMAIDNERNKKSTVGTVSYMPSLFGCIIASIVIRDIIEKAE
jgi:tRNA A37 threonylcarbamoyladenosine dehydratase